MFSTMLSDIYITEVLPWEFIGETSKGHLYIRECTAALFESWGGFNVDKDNYLQCQLVGLLGMWQLVVFKDEVAISQCEKILLEQISLVKEDSDMIKVFMSNIQSDIRALVYIGGVLSNNDKVIDSLFVYYTKFADELNSKGFFDEVTNLHTALMFSQTEHSIKLCKIVVNVFSL